MSDQHRALKALDLAVKHGFKFNTYEDGSTDYQDKDGFIDSPEDLAGSIAEFFDAKISELRLQLEEERQENASLRSGDDYERGAE